MDIKDQVCSLELSKRLKALGYPQKSLWYWVDYTDTSILPRNLEHKIDLATKEEMIELKTHNKEYPHCATIKKLKICSAPTVAETGIALPDGMQCNRIDYKDGMKEWHSWAWNFKPGFFGNTEANARVLMWEYLKKNGLLKGG